MWVCWRCGVCFRLASELQTGKGKEQDFVGTDRQNLGIGVGVMRLRVCFFQSVTNRKKEKAGRRGGHRVLVKGEGIKDVEEKADTKGGEKDCLERQGMLQLPAGSGSGMGNGSKNSSPILRW